MYNEIQEIALTSLVKNVLLITLGVTFIILLSSIGYEVFVKVNNELSNKLIFITALIAALIFVIYAYFPKIKMETKISAKFVEVKIGFLIHKRYSINKIVQTRKVEFQPIADFGGYGYRINSSKRALIANGDKGVELLFDDGSQIIVGTDSADEFLLALNNK